MNRRDEPAAGVTFVRTRYRPGGTSAATLDVAVMPGGDTSYPMRSVCGATASNFVGSGASTSVSQCRCTSSYVATVGAGSSPGSAFLTRAYVRVAPYGAASTSDTSRKR